MFLIFWMVSCALALNREIGISEMHACFSSVRGYINP